MPSIGFAELLLVAVVALVVIGPKDLPRVAKEVGLFLHNLKTNAKVLKDDVLGRHE